MKKEKSFDSIAGGRNSRRFPTQKEADEARALWNLLLSKMDPCTGEVTIGIHDPDLKDENIDGIEFIDAGGANPAEVRSIRINRNLLARIGWTLGCEIDGRQTYSFSFFEYMDVIQAGAMIYERSEVIDQLIESGDLESIEWEGERLVKTESVWAYIEKHDAAGTSKNTIMEKRFDMDLDSMAIRMKKAA